jgi:hypothetical protein
MHIEDSANDASCGSKTNSSGKNWTCLNSFLLLRSSSRKDVHWNSAGSAPEKHLTEHQRGFGPYVVQCRTLFLHNPFFLEFFTGQWDLTRSASWTESSLPNYTSPTISFYWYHICIAVKYFLCFFPFFFFFFWLYWGLNSGLRAYLADTVSLESFHHSTSLLLCLVFFEIRSHELFVWAGFIQWFPWPLSPK